MLTCLHLVGFHIPAYEVWKSHDVLIMHIAVLLFYRPTAETKKALASALVQTFPCFKDIHGSGSVSS